MKQLQFLVIFVLGITCSSFAIRSFEPTNVIINLNPKLQNDSIGYNLPLELPTILYNKILDGSIPLWDSPSKEIRISGDALKGIEQSSKTSFSSVSNLFIHEIWELSKRYLDAKTIGFTFINKTNDASVNYGYIDYHDIAELMKTTNIQSNANGVLNTSYAEAIQNKGFNFSIVQFGDQDFKTNPEQSFELKNSLFNNPKIQLISLAKRSPQLKSITYEINKEGSGINEAIFLSLTNYFNANLEQFYNMSGDQGPSLYNKTPDLILTKLKVTELYSNTSNGISSELISLQIFCNGKYLPLQSIAWFRQLDIMVKFKPIEAVIKEKNYDLKLVAINFSAVKNLNIAEVLVKLQSGQWNHLAKDGEWSN